MDQLSPGGNPYFERSMQSAIDQATQGFNRGTLPELESRSVGMGQYGQPRDQLARGEAAGMFGQGLARGVTQGYADQYGSDRALAGQALGQTGAMQSAQFAPQFAARDLLGGPTVLGRSSQFGDSSNFGRGTTGSQSTNFADASNFGNAVNYGQSTDASNQFSRSSGGAESVNASTSRGQQTAKGREYGQEFSVLQK
jgi:hypothetical protein